ncbi:Aldo/keto reductase [Stereum hirsutum FP-91666 SS1]|uniref:Aldo/keto reductase n=1 Tax=Stereum hirsutum (strain FP-91666) TaxID=721885 RepID=UPI000440BF29|nr:Aldo/keto reductase [Stereum hirsutum FP-91666 SS1]EIM90325.1 Aldo/keto reductase [Stereum hirsutum FP-91666 SS1]
MANTSIKLNDGNAIPWLGYGTGTALYQKDKECERMVTAAIKAGFTHLDGAQMYGNEASLGLGILSSGVDRSTLYITTKFHQLAPGETVRDSLKASLTRLQVEYVDLFLMHTPMGWGEPAGEGSSKLREVWRECEDVKREGLARSVGVSNFRERELEEVMEGARIVPAVNQIEYHPHVHDTMASLLAFHDKHGIVTASFAGLSPLFRSRSATLDTVLSSVAQRLSETAGMPVSEGAVLMAGQRAKGVVFVTTTKQEERLKGYLAAAEAPDLTPEEVEAIDEAGAKEHHRHFMTYWPGKEEE